MASQILSGATNASYTNNTGQNVRLIINYMSNVTSMTWAGVTVTATATNIGKDIPVSYSGNIQLSLPGMALRLPFPWDTASRSSRDYTLSGSAVFTNATTISLGAGSVGITGTYPSTTNTSLPITAPIQFSQVTNTNFPTEIMLANGQAFSSVCGAFNAVVIKEDGT